LFSNFQKAHIDLIELKKFYPEKNLEDLEILFEYYIDRSFIECVNASDDKVAFQKGIDSALKGLEISQNIGQKFKALTRLLWINLYQANLDESEKYLNNILPLVHKISNSHLLKEFYFGASWYYIEKGEFDKGLAYSRDGINLDNKSKNPNIGLYLYLYKAICELRCKNYDECLSTLKDALNKEVFIFSEKGSLLRGELLQVKAQALLEKSKYTEALKIIRESIKVYDDLLGEKKPYLAKAVSYKIQGDIFFRQKYVNNSIESFEKSLEMFETLTQSGGGYEFAEALLGAGKIFLQQKKDIKFKKIFLKLKKRFGIDHALTKELMKNAISYDKEWLLT
jgi:tetratricopeptide (TPR) repeat protein